MKEITNIQPVTLDIKSRTSQKEMSGEAKGAFEKELLQTVQKLENMENEIDAMIENPPAQSSTEISNGVDSVGNYINSIAGIVDDLSPEQTKNSTSAKFVTEQYSRAASKKES